MINPGVGAIDTAPHASIITRDEPRSSPSQSMHVHVHGPGDIRPDVALVFPKCCRSEKEGCGVFWIHDEFMSIKEIPGLRRFGNLGPPGPGIPGVIGAPNAKNGVALESG